LRSIHDVRWGGESRSGLLGRQCLDPVDYHVFPRQDVIASADKIVEDLAGQDDEFFAGGGTRSWWPGRGLFMACTPFRRKGGWEDGAGGFQAA
jgi:hypothetical protein